MKKLEFKRIGLLIGVTLLVTLAIQHLTDERLGLGHGKSSKQAKAGE